MAGVFGAMIIWDHPFMVFPLVGGDILHLPCGSAPTALIQSQRGCTTMQVAIPGAEPLTWDLAMTAEEAQDVFREGAKKLNRLTDAPEAIPFKP